MRGLKLNKRVSIVSIYKSHLLQMRGLKPEYQTSPADDMQSHLLQMRGLKLMDEPDRNLDIVASFTDAWIETV